MNPEDVAPEDDPRVAESARDTIFSGEKVGSMRFGHQLINISAKDGMRPLFDQIIQTAMDAREHFLSADSVFAQMAIIGMFLEGMQEWIRQNMEQYPDWMEKAVQAELMRLAKEN